MRVASVLDRKKLDLITVEPDCPVSEAVTLLDRHNIGSLPVVDGAGKLCGIFSERDVLRGLSRQGREFCGQSVSRSMTKNVVVCAPRDSIHEAIGRMSDHGVGQLPVMDEDRLVGIVSVGDLIRVMHESAEEENRQLLSYVHGTV